MFTEIAKSAEKQLSEKSPRQDKKIYYQGSEFGESCSADKSSSDDKAVVEFPRRETSRPAVKTKVTKGLNGDRSEKLEKREKSTEHLAVVERADKVEVKKIRKRTMRAPKKVKEWEKQKKKTPVAKKRVKRTRKRIQDSDEDEQKIKLLKGNDDILGASRWSNDGSYDEI